MTMPSRIWASHNELQGMTKPANEWSNPANAVAYIRADIAEELAKELQRAYEYGWQPARQVLARYEAIMEKG